MKITNWGFSWALGEDANGNFYAVHKKTGKAIKCDDKNSAIDALRDFHYQDCKSPY